MKSKAIDHIRPFFLVPLAILCVISAAAQAQTPAATGTAVSMPQGHMQQGNKGSDEMKHAMMRGMEDMQKMPLSSDTDKDFAMMMKMHHQQGVEMAKIELAQGKSPAMKAMAQQIIAAQQKEIAKFDQWLAQQK